MNKWMLLVLSLAGALGLQAEPLLSNAPETGIWTASYIYKVEVERPKDPAKARIFDRMQLVVPQPKSKTVYSTPGKRRIVMEWVAAPETEAWVMGDLLLYSRPNFKAGQISARKLGPGEMEAGEMPELSDFPELGWIRPGMKMGRSKIDGKEAEHYVYEVSANEETNTEATATKGPEKQKTILEAWIDSKTRLPLLMEDGEKKVVYSFTNKTPSSSDLTMSEPYKAYWDRLIAIGATRP